MLDKFPIDAHREFAFAPAKLKDDHAFGIWLRSARRGSNPRVMDAAELATLAFRRWREVLVKRVANDSADLIDRIKDNPHVEVTVLILIRAPWLRTNKLVGMCHLRRTWCNNVYIDFLTVHPRTLAGHNRPVKGIGTALLYFVTCIAKEIDAASIWGEATQNSAEFYQKVFSKPGIKDLIFLNKKDYTSFRDRITSDLLTVKPKASV